MFTTQTPTRSKFKLSPDISDDKLLKSFCKNVKEKLFPKVPDNNKTVHVDSTLEGQRPLDDLNIVVDEKVDLEEITESSLKQLGADISNTFNENTAFIIVESNESKSYRVKAATKKKDHAIKLIQCRRIKMGLVAHIMLFTSETLTM